jgi:hypothetical protein
MWGGTEEGYLFFAIILHNFPTFFLQPKVIGVVVLFLV